MTITKQHSADPASEQQTPPRRQSTLPRARGLLATQHPASTDAETESLREQRRQERYG